MAKVAAAPFGVVERFAEGLDGPALLPVTLRNVEAASRCRACRRAQRQRLYRLQAR